MHLYSAQVPPASVLIVVGVWLLPAPKQRPRRSLQDWLTGIDFGGSASLLVSVRGMFVPVSLMAGVLYVRLQIGAFLQYLSASSAIDAASHRTFAHIALPGSLAFFLVFTYVELRVARNPIMPLYLLTKRTSLCIGLIAGLVAVVNFNMVYHLGMLFEIVFQQPVSRAGAHLLPNAVSSRSV